MVDSRQCADMAKRVLSMYTEPLPSPKSNVNVQIKQFKDGKWGWVVYDGSLELSHSTRPYKTSQDASDGAVRYLHYLGRHVLAALGYTKNNKAHHGNYLEKI